MLCANNKLLKAMTNKSIRVDPQRLICRISIFTIVQNWSRPFKRYSLGNLVANFWYSDLGVYVRHPKQNKRTLYIYILTKRKAHVRLWHCNWCLYIISAFKSHSFPSGQSRWFHNFFLCVSVDGTCWRWTLIRMCWPYRSSLLFEQGRLIP